MLIVKLIIIRTCPMSLVQHVVCEMLVLADGKNDPTDWSRSSIKWEKDRGTSPYSFRAPNLRELLGLGQLNHKEFLGILHKHYNLNLEKLLIFKLSKSIKMFLFTWSKACHHLRQATCMTHCFLPGINITLAQTIQG